VTAEIALKFIADAQQQVHAEERHDAAGTL
jgi:hypothetical protein